MLALSTAWHPRRYSLGKVFKKAKKIGFREFELGVSAQPIDPDDAVDAVRRDEIKITSIHAVCSRRGIPRVNKRGDWIADLDAGRRRAGIDIVRETLDIAREAGARAVVLHGGVVPVPDHSKRQFRLYKMIEEGAPEEERERLRSALLSDRSRAAPACLDALAASLEELCAHAPDIVLALENRYYAAELPLDREFDELFDRVDAPNLRYWHDVGHAHILERIGLIDHLALLHRQSDRLMGVHLHDIRGFDDHRPPGTGDFDFAALKGYLRPDVLQVLEMGADLSARSIRRGAQHLATAYGIT